jgi:adenylate kinase
VKVLFTGQTGLDKKRVLERLAQVCAARGKAVDGIYHLGDLMYEESRKAGKALREGKILDLPFAELAMLRRSALWRVSAAVAGKQAVFVNSHAVFRWDNKLFPAFHFSDFEAFRPDIIVTLVDDVDAIKLRLDALRSAGQLPPESRIGLKDILVWREEEILASQLLAGALGVPHYIAGVGLEPEVDAEPLSTLYSLLFEQWKRTAYISYPISDAQPDPDLWGRVVRFRAMCRNYVTAFDPMMIDEKRLYAELRRQAEGRGGRDAVTVDVRGRPLELSATELQDVLPDVDGQIVARDYALIDQSQMLIAYFPQDSRGRALIAAGVQSEIEHAAASTKEVLVVWEAQKQPTPFIGMRLDRQFASVEALETHLREMEHAARPVDQLKLRLEG